MSEMNRGEAIAYLRRKGKIGAPLNKAEYSDEDEEEIEDCIKSGKCYGDPTISLNSW